MLIPTLEFNLRSQADGTLLVDAYLHYGSGGMTTCFAEAVALTLDRQALLAHTQDALTYGSELGRQFFAATPLREAWLQARSFAANGDLQVCLRLPATDPALHALYWERLRDPQDDDQPLALNERVRWARILASADLTPCDPPPRPALRALLLVANPIDLARYDLAEIDVEGTVARLKHALGKSIAVTLLGDHHEAHARATLPALLEQLRDPQPLVFLVAHGTTTHSDGPYIWLEHATGQAHPVPVKELVESVARLSRRPQLIVLASCYSAAETSMEQALRALAPELARRAGIPAVLGFQGGLAMGTMKRFFPPLVREIMRDGQIDRAVAAARASLGEAEPWWQAVLWLRGDGRLWQQTAQAPAPPAPLPQQPMWQRPPPPPMQGNPFTPGTVCPVERFIGRETAVIELVESLQNMQSSSLVGEARIGKTSLLTYLAAKLPRLLAPYGRYHAILFDMGRVTDPAHFYRHLVCHLLPHMPAGVGDQEQLHDLQQRLWHEPALCPSAEQTVEIIEWAAAGQLRIVLLLDEFRDILKRPQQFDSLFAGWMRSIYSTRLAAIIITTRQPLRQLPELKGFYMPNAISAIHTLDRFSATESARLVRQPHDRPFSPAEVELALAVGQDHPLRLQAASDQLYKMKGRPLTASPLHTLSGSLTPDAATILARKVDEVWQTVTYLSGDGA
ncbi:CHAT domain-containing protein [Candidatus Viridilinea mediisalina]|uniref:CHAT domain-containing protein n=1 Tax=Candidatus Viridilinea mediisalina TaxID=2024553 RepID=A0A2A6RG83_9CHLR|nr:CHAT domain-containing protein [Candidatus Viridilinea mediisalina]PDW01953.1 hypothetical protein CJ255_16380 [Candidatus Viridilinea mediisalina]